MLSWPVLCRECVESYIAAIRDGRFTSTVGNGQSIGPSGSHLANAG